MRARIFAFAQPKQGKTGTRYDEFIKFVLRNKETVCVCFAVPNPKHSSP
jgi:hypothetical protein